jgi:outer membrane protein OmpA-like peptidoglycan-associated protein
MRSNSARNLFPSHLTVFALAAAIAIPASAQQGQSASGSQDNSTSTAQPSQTAKPLTNQSKEGFWGRVNPMARKKWVKRQTDPINDRLTELDEVNAKNSKDIQDVDTRAQAGIKQAQAAADKASEQATAASTQAQNASQVATTASGRVDTLHTTVNGIDNYKQINEIDVPFKRGSTKLSDEATGQLDQLASSLKDHKGYVVEIEGHSPGKGVAGLQTSERLTEAVRRYLVEHDVPVYRVHAVALGDAQAASTNAGAEDNKPLKTSSVHIRLMENSLAARDSASPQGAGSTTGAERP